MIRWMLSLGTLLALALAISAASLELEAGLPPPSLTATAISRPILVKTLARAPSVFSFLRLMLFHLLCQMWIRDRLQTGADIVQAGCDCRKGRNHIKAVQ